MWDDISNLEEFSRVPGISFQIVCGELIQYSRHNLLLEYHLQELLAILQSLLVEPLTQLQTTFPEFQEPEVYNIHHA